MEVFVPDPLRGSVEAASGGQCTVLYSRGGTPSHFFVLPAFNIEDIAPELGSGVHPAFIIRGRRVPKLFIGMYQAKFLISGQTAECASLPGMQPDLLDTGLFSQTNCLGTGKTLLEIMAQTMPGAHIMTNLEWSAVALWCAKNSLVGGFIPHGNGEYGRDVDHPWERGVPTGFHDYTLTGSGPDSWRHNNAPNGIADLVGNASEWVLGLRLVEGEIQVCQDNDAATWTQGVFGGQEWRAINFSTGALVAPGTTGTVKVEGGPDQGFHFAATRAVTGGFILPFAEIEGVSALPPHLLLWSLGQLPGRAYVRNTGTAYPARGGWFFPDSEASLFTYDLTNASANTTVRIAKY